MLRADNKIYIGSSKRGYLNEEMISIIYKYLSTEEVYEFMKAKPRKIGDDYLLEVDVNDQTKEVLRSLRGMDQLKLYKRTQSWKSINKKENITKKAPN